MPRPKVESRPLAWPRVIVLALVGSCCRRLFGLCALRLSSYTHRSSAAEYGRRGPCIRSIRARRSSAAAGSKPTGDRRGGARARLRRQQSLGTYRSNDRYSDVTGSVANAPTQSGHWTWNGGSPVTVGYGETVDSIARQTWRACLCAHADQWHP